MFVTIWLQKKMDRFFTYLFWKNIANLLMIWFLHILLSSTFLNSYDKFLSFFFLVQNFFSFFTKVIIIG